MGGGQVKVFPSCFERDDIKAYLYTNGYNSAERENMLQKRKWVIVKAKSLRRREWIRMQWERMPWNRSMDTSGHFFHCDRKEGIVPRYISSWAGEDKD